MIITWLGQACVVIKHEGKTLVIDPYSPDIGITMPSLACDIGLITHAHADHNNTSALTEKPFIINEPGEYEIGGFFIETVVSFHDSEQGAKRGQNLIFIITVGGYRLAHFGDFGQASLLPAQLEALNEIDIAFLPVGGFYTIDGKQAASIVHQLEPKVVIPIHYQIPGLIIKELSDAEGFFDALGIKPTQVTDSWNVKAQDFPQEGTNAYKLEPTHPT